MLKNGISYGSTTYRNSSLNIISARVGRQYCLYSPCPPLAACGPRPRCRRPSPPQRRPQVLCKMLLLYLTQGGWHHKPQPNETEQNNMDFFLDGGTFHFCQRFISVNQLFGLLNWFLNIPRHFGNVKLIFKKWKIKSQFLSFVYVIPSLLVR